MGADTKKSGGNWSYTNTAESAAYVRFRGGRVDLVTSKTPTYGIMRVTVDNQAPVLVDLYDAGYRHQQKVFSAEGLTPSAEHTLTVEWTGTKNPSSSGTGIGVDAMDVVGYLTQAAAPVSPMTRYQQDNAKIVLDGAWSNITDSKRSGGSWTYTNSADTTANIAFTGTRIDIISSKAPTYGKMRVTLDNQAPVLVDLYDAGYIHQKAVWSAANLTDGPHTVSIQWTGLKNASSTGTGIGLDAVDLLGTLTQAQSTAPLLTRYEQDAEGITLSGDWSTLFDSRRSSGSWAYAAATSTGRDGDRGLHGQPYRPHHIDGAVLRHLAPATGPAGTRARRSVQRRLPAPEGRVEWPQPGRGPAYADRRMDGHEEPGLERHGHRYRRTRRARLADSVAAITHMHDTQGPAPSRSLCVRDASRELPPPSGQRL